jgi:hypothetical protein
VRLKLTTAALPGPPQRRRPRASGIHDGQRTVSTYSWPNRFLKEADYRRIVKEVKSASLPLTGVFLTLGSDSSRYNFRPAILAISSQTGVLVEHGYFWRQFLLEVATR